MTFIKALVFCLLITTSLKGQENKELVKALENADSIFLVSQELIFAFIKDSLGVSRRETLLIKGLPNKRIIKQVERVPDSLAKELVSVFKKPFSDRQIETCRSFPSDNGILIYVGGKIVACQLSIGCNAYQLEEGETGRAFLDKEAKRRLTALFKKLKVQVE